jgi:uncharacterized protein (TIGR03032 family)
MAKESLLEFSASRLFVSWLAQQRLSLAFTTYQAGKLFLIGSTAEGRLSGFERSFARCMGLWSDGQTIWLSSLYQIWRLENTYAAGEVQEGFDKLYVPQVGYVTGDVDVHDIAVDANGRLIFVNTLFSCLATVSERYSFEPIWQPPFVTRLAPEDRCHLNGLAMRDGRPRYVTACSQSDVVEGWRSNRIGGGCVIDVESNEILCDGLSMPHSPRWHNDALWVLDTGSGHLGRVDIDERRFEPVTFCPGYSRGLAFSGKYAIVGLSKCRQERTFAGLPLEENLKQRQGAATCGLLVVDTTTSDIVHWLRLDGVIDELYDVAVLPGVVRPKALGFKTDEIRHVVWLEEKGRASRWRALTQ